MIQRFFNSKIFNKISDILVPICSVLLPILLTSGLYYALVDSPADYQQGEMVRIMYVHVPSAWMSLGIYIFMAICSFSSIVWKTKISYILALSSAPIGAMFAFITLVTGSIWGKPVWGTWWVWDARLTSMLILFFLYMSYIIIVNTGSSKLRAEKPASIISIIGVINIPIIKFSVDFWHSLHQPASILRAAGPSIHKSMLIPLMIMFTSFIIYFILMLIINARINFQKLKMNNK